MSWIQLEVTLNPPWMRIKNAHFKLMIWKIKRRFQKNEIIETFSEEKEGHNRVS